MFLERHRDDLKQNGVLAAQVNLLSAAAAQLETVNGAKPEKLFEEMNAAGEGPMSGGKIRQGWSAGPDEAPISSTICRSSGGDQEVLRHKIDPSSYSGGASRPCLFRQV